MASSPGTVDILMGTHNGAPHLPGQLQSLADQHHRAWRLICSDDGSGDETCELIREFAAQVPQDVVLRQGPEAGFAANYMGLIRDLDPAAGLIALADQDDIWCVDKLARAVRLLEGCDPDRPVLYCARRWVWRPETNQRLITPLPARRASFRNALIENIAFGNTIVLTPAAARLARQAAQRTGAGFAHDWWLYLLITGAGGQVVFDPGPPCLLYRQHATNVIGGSMGARSEISRKFKAFRGAFRDRLKENLAAMLAIEDLLTPENRHLVRTFSAACEAGWPARLAGLARVRPYRQSMAGNLGFWGAAVLGRV